MGMALANGAISSVQPDFFAKFFGANIRYSGISIGREGATIIGGGLAPVIATALIQWGGGSWPVAACMAATSLVGFLVVLLAKNVDLQHADLQKDPARAPDESGSRFSPQLR
jgi:MFS family permease